MSPDKQMKVTTYSHLNKIAQKGQILLTGSSLCEFFPAAEIARSFGFDGILLTGDSADPWARPVTRSGMDNLEM